MNKISKAIIIAAGRGSRLMPLTDGKPKCLIEVGAKTILERQFEVLRGRGITDIIVVRGYKKELINYPEIKYCENTDYLNNNILKSLFYAEKEMDKGFIFSYSDIIYGEDIVKTLLKTKGDIVLVVDTNWQKHYKGRKKHPVGEAELVKVKNGKIIKIGKDVVKINESHGEFIGLAKFSDAGAKIVKDIYRDLLNKYKENDFFQHAKEFKKAYLTDFIQELIDRGNEINIININHGWIEIDTDEDLERAERQWGD